MNRKIIYAGLDVDESVALDDLRRGVTKNALGFRAVKTLLNIGR